MSPGTRTAVQNQLNIFGSISGIWNKIAQVLEAVRTIIGWVDSWPRDRGAKLPAAPIGFGSQKGQPQNQGPHFNKGLQHA